jgi:hypothetical protein
MSDLEEIKATAVEEAPIEAAPVDIAEDTSQPKEDEIDATLAAMVGDDQKKDTPENDAEPAAVDPPKEPAVGAEPPVKPKADDKLADTFEEELKEHGPTTKRQEVRMKQLYDRARKADEMAPLAERLREWEEQIATTGATPDQFGGAMNYLTLLNSGNPENLATAFEQIEGEYLALAKALGRPTSAGYDPIADHPDIAAKLANLDVDRETALELISARNRSRNEQASQESRRLQEGQQAAETHGRNALVALESELLATDRAYAEKLRVLAPALQGMTQATNPDQWATVARRMFANLNLPPSPKPTGATPMRATVSGGSHAKPVSDPVDAVFAAMTSGQS